MPDGLGGPPDATNIRVIIEDHPVLGPEFYPASAAPPGSWGVAIDPQSFFEVGQAQVERWQVARTAWEEAQGEMRHYVNQASWARVETIRQAAGFEAAVRAERRRRR